MAKTSDQPNSGYSAAAKTYHSKRSPPPLPPKQPLSISEYALSLLQTTASTGAIINATTDQRLSYSSFIHHVETLASSLQLIGLSKGDVAFVISPPCIQIPILYFSLLSIGVVVSPTNPIATKTEIKHQIDLSKPVIAFATAATKSKLPNFRFKTILIDSAEFDSMWREEKRNPNRVEINQSDPAAILYSSGTTGRVKGVLLTHLNFIALIAGIIHAKQESPTEADSMPFNVSVFTVPLFHVFGFFMVFMTVALGDTIVLMERFDFEVMLRSVEKYRVTNIPVSPPLVLALAKSEVVRKYDLSSLRTIGCGGAPLGKEVIERFLVRFPNVEIVQGYGLTETSGAVAGTIGPEESKKYGSVGLLSGSFEAKIVDPTTGEALPPGHRGELWLRGPTIMKGYVGDDKATAETLDPEGWLKTGDLCYFDSEGFLYIVDRLKELIKYKAYQVAPAELEHIIQSNPEIADAAVIPYPNEEAGEIPMAVVVRKLGSHITGDQVMDFVAKHVAPYKKIRRVAFMNAIPKNPAGKILRRVLINNVLSPPAKL